MSTLRRYIRIDRLWRNNIQNTLYSSFPTMFYCPYYLSTHDQSEAGTCKLFRLPYCRLFVENLMVLLKKKPLWAIFVLKYG